jgi:hypothetical protein
MERRRFSGSEDIEYAKVVVVLGQIWTHELIALAKSSNLDLEYRRTIVESLRLAKWMPDI